MEKEIAICSITKDFEKETTKNKIGKAKLKIFLAFIFLLCLSFALSSIFLFVDNLYGHDLYYHLNAIRSLNDAWQNGTFGSRIYSLICQDYGYGTGLFYSMIPAGIAVILMNIFSISARVAIFLEFSILFFLSSIVIFFFTKRVFKKYYVSFICAIFYICFPYFTTNLYVRFAFSESFIMLALPLTAWGLFELLENDNKRMFFALFTSGFSLAILTHFTMSFFIAIILVIYILLNFKKFFTNKRWLIFLLSVFVILLITACYYIPMLVNFGLTQTSTLSASLYSTTSSSFSYYYLMGSMFVSIFIWYIFVVVHLLRPKIKRKLSKKFLIISTICLILVTPLFPWMLLDTLPFTLLQFAWRLHNFNALTSCLMLGFIVKHTNKTAIKTVFITIVYIALAISFVVETGYSLKSALANVNIDSAVSLNSGLSFNYGLGANKYGDYYPLGATNVYVFTRANSSFVLESNAYITELANCQSINQISFLVSYLINANPENNPGYIVLNIPYSVCENLTIFQFSTSNSTYFHDLSQKISAYEIDGEFYLKIEIYDYEENSVNLNTANNEFRIVINYEDDGIFDKYLQENPFEFIVKSGDASFTNFIKTGSNYTVEITTSQTTTIELPTLYYKGYKITYTTESGTYELQAVHGKNGFIEITVNDSGTLFVEFEANYVTVSNAISAIGIVAFGAIVIVSFAVPKIKNNKRKKLKPQQEEN